MDGKTLRGTEGHEKADQQGVHLLSFYECQSGIVLAQRSVGSKENEISAAEVLLHPALVKGRLISADAIHTQKKWCAAVTAYDGDYLLMAKDNQPTLRQDLTSNQRRVDTLRRFFKGQLRRRKRSPRSRKPARPQRKQS